ncbi:universal stress protein [Arthrobacter sp. NPDC093125]|uniref:universal stress protein n=1 Tax=Arthrobacter sp. NPDC093125 TaxID=3363944 RepID=UPI00382205B9
MTGVIVVGVDGSETARKAAESARDLALALGTTLHVITAFDGDHTVVFGTGSDQLAVSTEDNAEKVARSVAVDLSTGELKVAYFAVRGTPAQALLKQAEKYGARMIVVGNKRMQGIGRVLGSIASSVAHNAPCDVYIAKTDI